MKKNLVPKAPIDMASCAAFLGVTESDVRKMIRSGFLEAKKEGELMLFDITQLHVLRRTIQAGDKKEILGQILAKHGV